MHNEQGDFKHKKIRIDPPLNTKFRPRRFSIFIFCWSLRLIAYRLHHLAF